MEGKNLIDGLCVFEIPDGKQAIIYLMLKTDKQKAMLIDFMLDNKNATEDQIMAEAEKISNQMA